MSETKEIPQTSFEKEHKIDAGAPLTRGEVEQETPEQHEERVKRDIEAGKRAPAPETVDQTKSTVTPDQVKAYGDAEYKPQNPAAEGDDKKGDKKASSHASSHSHKK